MINYKHRVCYILSNLNRGVFIMDFSDQAIQTTETATKSYLSHALKPPKGSDGKRATADGKGNFICEECLGIINPKRMEILPNTSVCVECAEILQSK